jgi:oxygen-independent coproporphyrinogen-3 oxidase
MHSLAFEPPPLALYIHIPWCVKKCPYCDFNSHTQGDQLPEQAYIQALLRDFQQHLPQIKGRMIGSIFIGGGTPSLFSGTAFNTLLTQISQHIALAPNLEITLEANPGTLEHGRFTEYRQAGINRLSLGVQSFNATHLLALGRIHGPNEALTAVQEIDAAGFDNFNLDLMYALPHQSVSQALDDLEQALALNPTHLSWYQLTLEPNTAFYRAPPVLPDEDCREDIADAGQALLAARGYYQYEVSAYAPQQSCQHNRNYWEFGDYLGIGAGAHSKITQPNQIIRSTKIRHPKRYLQASDSYVADSQPIPATHLPFEFMLNALRLKQGCSSTLFTERTYLPFTKIEGTLAKALDQGLIYPFTERLVTTPKGWQFLNNVTSLFLP